MPRPGPKVPGTNPSSLLLLIALVAGCQKTQATPDGGATVPPVVEGGASAPTPSTACETSAALYCQQLFKCDPENAKQTYGSQESCQQADASECNRLALLPGVSPKSIESWAACNQALGARTCEEARFGAYPEACRLPPGMRKVGEPCTAAAQCATAFCNFPEDPTRNLDPADCGTCAPPPGVGEPCDEVHFCDFGLNCTDGFSRGDTGKCVRLLAEGETCDPMLYSECRGYLVCTPGGRCSKPLPAGAACRDFECAEPLRCVDLVCATGVAEGDPCDPNQFSCAGDLRCNADGICHAPKPSGADCGGDLECASYSCTDSGANTTHTCDTATTTVYAGEACGSEPNGDVRACHWTAYCDVASKRCVARKAVGAACAEDGECIDATCSAGRCQRLPEPMCR